MKLQSARSVWFNATSSTFAFMNRDAEKAREVKDFQELLVRLTSLLFVTALNMVSEVKNMYEVLDLDGIDDETLRFFRGYPNKEAKMELVLQWIQRLLVHGHDSGIINIPAPILARVFNELAC